jgi:hypothetical protein
VKGYRQMIADVTGISDPAVVGAIEEIMRIDNPTLGHLSARTFNHAYPVDTTAARC